MTTSELIATLEGYEKMDLIFWQGKPIGPGYHVTEVKQTTVDAMDCGGNRRRWSETVVQLWSPKPTASAIYMSAGKFLRILRRVAAAVPLDDGSIVRIEYGAAGSPAISHLVRAVHEDGNAVVVSLDAPAVACKPATNFEGEITVIGESADCCADAGGQVTCCP